MLISKYVLFAPVSICGGKRHRKCAGFELGLSSQRLCRNCLATRCIFSPLFRGQSSQGAGTDTAENVLETIKGFSFPSAASLNACWLLNWVRRGGSSLNINPTYSGEKNGDAEREEDDSVRLMKGQVWDARWIGDESGGAWAVLADWQDHRDCGDLSVEVR